MIDTLKRYALPLTIGFVVLISAAFGAWYLYLHQQQAALSTATAGRGLGSEIASGFPVGSAYSNAVNAIAGIFGGSAGSTSTPIKAGLAPRLWEIASAPTAGITILSGTSSPYARFVDQSSGNIFDADPSTSAVARRTNTLLPKIAEVAWAGSGGIIARYLDEQGIESFSGTIRPATTTAVTASTADALASAGPGTFSGAMLPRGIISIATDPKSSSIFYIAPYNGGVGGYLANADGSNPKRIWESSLSGWQSEWVGNHIVLMQKPSNGISGNAYDLSRTGTITPLASSIPGLSLVENPVNGDVLESSVTGNGSPKLSVVTAKGAVIDLPFATFAEKCVWDTTAPSAVYCGVPHVLPSALLPDAWYRGEVHSADSWWKFDTATGAVANVYDPMSDNHSLDILDPVISADGTYLAFIDDTTGTAWMLRIKN